MTTIHHCQYNKVLFIIKKRASGCSWGEHKEADKTSGLYNSASFINDLLNQEGIHSKLIEAVDNNCIDRHVSEFKPTIVIIEAFWVIPEKFEILKQLHPTVKWVIRNHSNWPFASMEGNLIDWALKYVIQSNVFVSCNKKETSDSFRKLVKIAHPELSDELIEYKTPFLPNYYPINPVSLSKSEVYDKNEIHIGNFGAIRPLKNNLISAMAAIIFADKIGKRLVYHINGGRVEGRAEPIAKSIAILFTHLSNSKLINEGWKSHDDFLQLCANMDMIMQISFDETFNIVAADAVNVETLLVGSAAIPWLSDKSIVENITDISNIVERMETLYAKHWWNNSIRSNKRGLKKYVEKSKDIWIDCIISGI